MSKKKVTIRDVAAKLGLSAMTVSLALRDNPRISAETKERVRAAMDKLGYKPSHVARALATGKSNLLGVIVPNSSDHYYAEVIRAIEDRASAAYYHVLLANGSYEMERYIERVRDMMSLQVGGIIAAPPFTSAKPKLPPFWQTLRRGGGGLMQNGQVGQLELKNKVDGLNAAGRYCKSKGLRLAYHNHGPEFAVGGQEIESLARLTDPELVDFLVDCGWAFRAQADVPVFFTNHHQRICGLHLRDFKNGEQVPLGQGEFPIRELAAVIKKVNWSGWAINEEERLSGDKPGEKAVAPARQALKQVFGK